jgi:hypothetical protein
MNFKIKSKSVSNFSTEIFAQSGGGTGHFIALGN